MPLSWCHRVFTPGQHPRPRDRRISVLRNVGKVGEVAAFLDRELGSKAHSLHLFVHRVSDVQWLGMVMEDVSGELTYAIRHPSATVRRSRRNCLVIGPSQSAPLGPMCDYVLAEPGACEVVWFGCADFAAFALAASSLRRFFLLSLFSPL